MLLCASCSEESMFESTLTGENVINATFEQGTSGSRVALVQGDNDALSLKWTAGDAIAVLGEDGTKAVYTLDAGSVGQSNGSFVGQNSITGNVKGVVYPYYETGDESNVTWEQWQDLKITLPSEITFDPNEPTKCNVLLCGHFLLWPVFAYCGIVTFNYLCRLIARVLKQAIRPIAFVGEHAMTLLVSHALVYMPAVHLSPFTPWATVGIIFVGYLGILICLALGK